MLKTLGAQIKEYKWASIATPVFMLLEVAVDTIIPLLMASIIDNGVNMGDTRHIYIMGVYDCRSTVWSFDRMSRCKIWCKGRHGLWKESACCNVSQHPDLFLCKYRQILIRESCHTYDNRCDQHPECLHDAASHGYESPCVHNMCDGYVIFHQPSPCDNILNRCHCAWSFTAFHQ